MISIKNPEACTGCLICEMACSFHHFRIFSRSQSSIRVNKSISNPEKVPQIFISYGGSERTPACDHCDNEDNQLCIEFCPQHIIYESAETNSRGYSIVRMEDGGHCIGCEMCTMVCPEFAIHVVGPEDGA